MDPMPLSFATLIAYLNRAIGQIQDSRQRNKANLSQRSQKRYFFLSFLF